MDIEIRCSTYGCHSTMSEKDEVFCEGCYRELEAERDALQKKVSSLEDDVNRLEDDLASSSAAAVELKDIIKACSTCSAILVAKNL